MPSPFSEYLGVIARTHGVDGTIALADTVGLHVTLAPGSTVGIGFSREFAKDHVVDAFQSDTHRTTLRLRGITTPELAETLIDQAVYVRPEDAGVVEEDRYAIGDIEGCTVVLENGTTLGTITEVWLLPANDVWVVTTPSATTIPLPVIDEVVLSIDLPGRRIVVRLLPGLESVNEHSKDDDHDA